MFLQPNISARRFITLGIALLLLHAFIGMSRSTYAEETEQQPPETIDEIISATVEQTSSESIDEIIVYGDRPLSALRQEVYRTEENFFDLFSSLNEDDDYDVRCFYEVPSFTHIRRHVCRARFVTDATSAESAPAFSEKVGNFSRPAAYEIRRKKERLRELMETLVAEHPELAQALNKYTDSRQILESEKEKR